MFRKVAFLSVLVCVLVFAGAALAAMPAGTQCVVSYDGYLSQDLQALPSPTILADTLIVVTNSHPNKTMIVLIDVFDRTGAQVGAQTTLLGGPLVGPPALLTGNQIPPDGSGWIALSNIVNRSTIDPWGLDGGGEKFSFRIYTQRPDNVFPVVEVKQIIYSSPLEEPQEGFPVLTWMPQYFKTWCEAGLGGTTGTGVIFQQ